MLTLAPGGVVTMLTGFTVAQAAGHEKYESNHGLLPHYKLHFRGIGRGY